MATFIPSQKMQTYSLKIYETEIQKEFLIFFIFLKA